jgi:AcrR family transcriptional regulator
MAKRIDLSNDKIIEATEELIANKGANDFSLADVAKATNISKGTLYYHYPTKDSLILDILERHMRALSSDYDAWLLRHKEEGISEERFLSVILYKGVSLFNKAKIHIYLINECVKSNKTLSNKYRDLWNSWEKKIETGIKTYFPTIKDYEAFAYLIMLLTDGLSVQEALGNSQNLDQRLIALLTRKE